MIVKAVDLVEQITKTAKDYFCLPFHEYLKGTHLPTSIDKQDAVILLLVERGTLQASIGYQEVKFHKNELMVIQPSKPYSILKVNNDFKGIIYFINENSMIGTMEDHSLILSLDILETWSDSKYSLNSEYAAFITNIFKRIQYEYSLSESNLTIVNAYTITLLLELKSIHNINNGKLISAIDLVRRYKREIAQNIDQKYSTSDYAQKLSITTNHLNKSVKSTTGMSASQLLHKMKVAEAKYLLYLADVTVEEVGVRLGFDDLSYFSRFFKKHEGITPSEFRKNTFSAKKAKEPSPLIR